MTHQEKIIVYEYHHSKELDESQKKSFEKYIKDTEINKKKGGVIGNFKNRNIGIKENTINNWGSNVGIIEFDKYRTEFRPKLDVDNIKDNKQIFWEFLPNMLNKLYYYKRDDLENGLFLDPQKVIDLPKGSNIGPLLTLAYIGLCEKVIQEGILKKYVKKEERLHAIRGRINFNQLAKQRAWNLEKIPCRYSDLTFDNPENQIILWCANRLLKRTRKIKSINNNSIIVKKLREQYSMLSEEISLIPKTKNDLLNINISNAYGDYKHLMNICKAILEERIFSFEEKTNYKNKGINFILDMDWVFEQYMTSLFEEVVKEYFNEQLQTMPQEKIDCLGDNGRIKMQPDLIISAKINNRFEPIAVIDFKWKKRPTKVDNPDLFQIICYSLVEIFKYHKEKIDAILYLASLNNQTEGNYETISKLFGKEKKTINIKIQHLENDWLNGEPEEIEGSIKKRIHTYLENLLNESKKTNNNSSN